MSKKIDLDRIITELAKDNEASLEELFNYYYSRLYNFSRSFLKIEDDIDDILQEVFIKIWHNRKKINSSASFNSFIFTITRNLLLNELRSQLNHQNLKDNIQKLSLAPEYDVVNQVEFNEIKDKVNKLIDELPERQKQVFILSRMEGLSQKKIAEKLGIRVKTVEYHMSLAISSLKAQLKRIDIMSLLYFCLFF